MPEGDTLRRTAQGLRPFLVGRRVLAASARQPGPRADRLVGSTVIDVEAVGKNLIITFDPEFDGRRLALRTHLGLHGSWHRYAPGERWKRPPSRARIAIEVDGATAVCFDAPTIELLDERALGLESRLGGLGPDLLDDDFEASDDGDGIGEAVRRLRDPTRRTTSIAAALLDQRALAGIGNVYKNEVLFIERVNPFDAVGALSDDALRRLVGTAHRLLAENVGRALRRTTGTDAAAHGDPFWVYGRAGRPCRRCGTLLAQERHGDPPRRTIWCPGCQPAARPPSSTEDRRPS